MWLETDWAVVVPKETVGVVGGCDRCYGSRSGNGSWCCCCCRSVCFFCISIGFSSGGSVDVKMKGVLVEVMQIVRTEDEGYRRGHEAISLHIHILCANLLVHSAFVRIFSTTVIAFIPT